MKGLGKRWHRYLRCKRRWKLQNRGKLSAASFGYASSKRALWVRLKKLGKLAQSPTCVAFKEVPDLDDWVHESGPLVLVGEAAHPLPVSPFPLPYYLSVWVDFFLPSNTAWFHPRSSTGNRRRRRPRQTLLPPPLALPNPLTPIRIPRSPTRPLFPRDQKRDRGHPIHVPPSGGLSAYARLRDACEEGRG